ncbi:MAG: hypothetical protein MHMPM18_005078 [Marteilia pararefringens]
MRSEPGLLTVDCDASIQLRDQLLHHNSAAGSSSTTRFSLNLPQKLLFDSLSHSEQSGAEAWRHLQCQFCASNNCILLLAPNKPYILIKRLNESVIALCNSSKL